MAEVLMRRRIADRMAPGSVSSAGLLEGGQHCPQEIVALMDEVGVDLRERPSRRLTPELLETADLVLTMERRHLRDIAVMVTSAWERTFTLKEFVRRGTTLGWRTSAESTDHWVARLHAEREPAELLGSSSTDDVADPYGGTVQQYTATQLELDSLVSRVADLIWPDEAALLGFTAGTAGGQPGEPTSMDQPARRSRFGLSRRH